MVRQTIVALENGKYSPSLALAFKFSRIFGKTVEEIFEPDDDGVTPNRRTPMLRVPHPPHAFLVAFAMFIVIGAARAAEPV